MNVETVGLNLLNLLINSAIKGNVVQQVPAKMSV